MGCGREGTGLTTRPLCLPLLCLVPHSNCNRGWDPHPPAMGILPSRLWMEEEPAGYHRHEAHLLWIAVGSWPLACGPPPSGNHLLKFPFGSFLSPPSDHSVNVGLTLPGFPRGSAGKESSCSAGDLGSIPGLGRSTGEGKGYPLHNSGLDNSMDFIAHAVAESNKTE